tara:strand:+ start:12024 stop:12206 length:183 start_codon:yes stop_codon:yes gene_type:complete
MSKKDSFVWGDHIDLSNFSEDGSDLVDKNGKVVGGGAAVPLEDTTSYTSDGGGDTGDDDE